LDLLMGTAHGAKALIDAIGRLIMYIIIKTYVPVHMVVQFFYYSTAVLFLVRCVRFNLVCDFQSHVLMTYLSRGPAPWHLRLPLHLWRSHHHQVPM
jgi:hypothetical protein